MRLIALGFVILLFGGCGGGEEPVPQVQPEQSSEQDQDSSGSDVDPALVKVCEAASELIESYEPGTAPRKKAVALANEAFIIDDSVEVTSAFSNLNNVYVYDDGISSEAEVQAQLEEVCS